MATAAKPRRKYVCALCGATGHADSFVYSSFTGNRFCKRMVACDRRRKRKRNAA